MLLVPLGMGALKIHGNSVDGSRTPKGQVNVTGSLTNSRKLSKRKQVLFKVDVLIYIPVQEMMDIFVRQESHILSCSRTKTLIEIPLI